MIAGWANVYRDCAVLIHTLPCEQVIKGGVRAMQCFHLGDGDGVGFAHETGITKLGQHTRLSVYHDPEIYARAEEYALATADGVTEVSK